jgi:hypothetical protein
VACPGADFGISCIAGYDPARDGNFCSVPMPVDDAGLAGRCCIATAGGAACRPASPDAGCAFPSIGFSCAGDASPDLPPDSGITCPSGTFEAPANATNYCCQ